MGAIARHARNPVFVWPTVDRLLHHAANPTAVSDAHLHSSALVAFARANDGPERARVDMSLWSSSLLDARHVLENQFEPVRAKSSQGEPSNYRSPGGPLTT